METTIMENQMEKKMENEMETGIIMLAGAVPGDSLSLSPARCTLAVLQVQEP